MYPIHSYICTSARKWLVRLHNLRLIISITCVYTCSLAQCSCMLYVCCVCVCVFALDSQFVCIVCSLACACIWVCICLCIFVFLSEPQCTGKSVMTRLEGRHAIRLIALLPTRVEPSANIFTVTDSFIYYLDLLHCCPQGLLFVWIIVDWTCNWWMCLWIDDW